MSKKTLNELRQVKDVVYKRKLNLKKDKYNFDQESKKLPLCYAFFDFQN